MTPVRYQQIRKLLWLYFWLLIFEGALRKWIFPGLSNPLLLVRDPIALVAVCMAWPLLCQPKWRQWILPLFVLGAVAFIFAITLGHGDIPVAVYGARVLLLQLPLIFLYPAVFDRSDVIRFAWSLVWLSIPMTLLIVAQSNLPSTALLNVAPGGEGTSVFAGALGRFRPAGVFSFSNALALFYTITASSLFILIYCSRLSQARLLIIILASISLIVAQPVSISRSLLAGYLQVFLALIGSLILSRARLFPIFAGACSLALVFSLATNVPAYQETSKAFAARWEHAAEAESNNNSSFGGGAGVFQTRVLTPIFGPLDNLDHVLFFGRGIGIGTNVGSQRLSGSITYLIGEGAVEVILGEMGFALGLGFLIWRFALFIWVIRLAFRQALLGNVAPFILLGSSLLTLATGQLSQPTGVGFIVFSTGLTLAACNQKTFIEANFPHSDHV